MMYNFVRSSPHEDFHMNPGKLNPVIDFINTLCNFFALNLAFQIICLPVFTIGTALASLYYVTLKQVKREYGYLVRTYLREFKRNFKNGTLAPPASACSSRLTKSSWRFLPSDSYFRSICSALYLTKYSILMKRQRKIFLKIRKVF